MIFIYCPYAIYALHQRLLQHLIEETLFLAFQRIPLKIAFIANQVFPISSLPNATLAALCTNLGQNLGFR